MENINELTGAGRALRRLVRRNGEGETYESDEENPYASVCVQCSHSFSNTSFDYLLG